jgi:hypothetical protein
LNITGGSRVDENTNVGGGGSGAINGGTGVVSGGYSATSQQTTINSNSGVQNNN